MNGSELFQRGEGKTLEFKRNLSSPKNLLKTMVAFANSAGGRMIIGVDDKTRSPVGIKNPLDEEERLCNLIEQWGSGIPRIFREAEELGLPDLKIREIGMRIRFTVPLIQKIRIQEPTEQVIEQVTEQVKRILACLKDGPLGARDAMYSLGLRHRPTFLYDYLKPALSAGFLEMTQPDSPRSPTQKYRLTAQGKVILGAIGYMRSKGSGADIDY